MCGKAYVWKGRCVVGTREVGLVCERVARWAAGGLTMCQQAVHARSAGEVGLAGCARGSSGQLADWPAEVRRPGSAATLAPCRIWAQPPLHAPGAGTPRGMALGTGPRLARCHGRDEHYPVTRTSNGSHTDTTTTAATTTGPRTRPRTQTQTSTTYDRVPLKP